MNTLDTILYFPVVKCMNNTYISERIQLEVYDYTDYIISTLFYCPIRCETVNNSAVLPYSK